jgi:hypothetical protein
VRQEPAQGIANQQALLRGSVPSGSVSAQLGVKPRRFWPVQGAGCRKEQRSAYSQGAPPPFAYTYRGDGRGFRGIDALSADTL